MSLHALLLAYLVYPHLLPAYIGAATDTRIKDGYPTIWSRDAWIHTLVSNLLLHPLIAIQAWLAWHF